MKHEYGQFHSWNIVNENIGIKQSDKSFFKYNGSAVPAAILWFFDAEDMRKNTRRKVTFSFNGNNYNGHIERDYVDAGRVRIFWESKLGAIFAPYNTESAYPQFQFEKVSSGYYNITILADHVAKTDIGYSVNDVVWIATALMAAEVYTNNQNATKTDMYFKQADIVKRAQTLTNKNVDSERVSWWVNADHEKSTCNYLRADADDAKRRLSMIDEFDSKTYPHDLDLEDTFTIDDSEITMEELLSFVREQYPSVIREEKKFVNPGIDYIGVLAYLENNYEVPYSNPNVSGISSEKKAELLSIKQKGQTAVTEMKKMAQQAELFYGLDKCLPGSWLDGSNTKTRKYLWSQMKYKTDNTNPVSISIFVEKGKYDKAYFRISLEIKNDGTDKAGMVQYHKHFELSQKPGLVYVAGSNEWGNPAVLDETQNVVMSKVAGGTYKKVQICKVIEQKEGKTNDYYHQEVMNAIGDIIPYYNHVLGKSKPAKDKRGWLLTWNPANWTWDEYEEWCSGTKKGETYTTSWTCNSKQPQVGDDIFLMKTGAQPRGIMAHGRVATTSYEGPHYDPDKAVEGVKTNHIDVEYDWIQNCDKGEKILLQDDLKEKYPQQTWSPMGSGIEIKEPILTVLKEEWNEFTSISKYWPSLAEYDPGISTEDWVDMLLNADITNEATLTMLFRMLKLGGESTCANLSERYGDSAHAYNIWGRTFGERVHKATGCPLCKDEDRKRFFTIPFVGRRVLEQNHGRYSWKLRDELKEALESDTLIDIKSKMTVFKEGQKNPKYAKNMILYGPPGTGKTYATTVYAVAIIENKTVEEVKEESYDAVFKRYNQYKEDGLVAFTTFHQSYGYEEFIEGIKPIVGKESNTLGYKIEDGVFKEFCVRASKHSVIPEDVDIEGKCAWSITVDTKEEFELCCKFESVGIPLYDVPKCFTDEMLPKDIDSETVETLISFQYDIEKGDVVILTNTADKEQLFGIITGDADYDALESDVCPRRRAVRWYSEKKSVCDVPESICCKLNIELSEIVEAFFSKGIKNYVFIVDEINRGNISKIFGELITLIEDTKRAGMDEAASAILPYSGKLFSVPSNVYILGTMNTADRSIALMDTALRRRFEFIEMMPDTDVLRKIGADKVGELDVAKMLEAINERITFLYDREHTIGHAFFTKLAKKPTIETLKSIFEKSVIPLLQEYFYEDYQKIQLVLGDNDKSDDKHKFILDSDVKVKDIFKGSVDDVIDLPEKKYTINSDAFGNIDSYKEII